MPEDQTPSPHPVPSSPARPSLRVWVRRLVPALVWIIAIGLILRFFSAVRIVALGFLAISALVAAVRPLMKYIPGPRWIGGLLVGIVPTLILAGLLTLTSWLLAAPVKREIAQWPQVEQSLNGVLKNISSSLGISPPLTVQTLEGDVFGLFGTSQGGSQVARGGVQVVATTGTIATELFIVLIFVVFGTIYLLAAPPGQLVDPLLKMLPPHRRSQLKGATDDLDPRLRWWVYGTIVAMIIVGVGSWVGFHLTGLMFALPLAVLCGASEIVPTVGPAISFLIALFFAAAQGWAIVIGVLIVWIAIHLLEAEVIIPLVMNRAVLLPPVVTLFTVVLWGEAFGIAGLLLAVPLDLTVWSFADHFLIRSREGQEQAVSSP